MSKNSKARVPHGRPPKHLFSGLLVCADCGSPFSIHSGPYYRCSANVNRGPAICKNGKILRRDSVEKILLRAIFEEVYSPETVAYVTKKVYEAMARLSARPNATRKRLQPELDQARAKLENVKAAILDGVRTPTTREMLEEWEARVASLEAALALSAKREQVIFHPAAVDRYLRDLKGTFAGDVDQARVLLHRLVGKIMVRREGNRLVAEIGGNLPALLDLEDFGKYGAGRGISYLPKWPPTIRVVA